MIDIESLQRRIAPLFPGLMGVVLLEAAPDRVLAELKVRPDLCTAGGIMHGGAYMAFADTLGAIGTVVNLTEGRTTTTTDSSTKFIAGARVGTVVTGESVALHRGRTTMVWQTAVRNADGRLCALVTQTQLVLDAPAARPPAAGGPG
ncbi:MAG: PaaI family thioesterase [Lautropia sp.]